MKQKRLGGAEEKQSELCRKLDITNFSAKATGPGGICPSCGCDIYGNGGYTAEDAAKELITGCPFCHRSYVE